MMALTITFKNGKSMNGLLWSWRPEEGWFEALNEKNGKIKSYKLKDIKNGVLYQTRDRRDLHGAEQLLDKARADGWD